MGNQLRACLCLSAFTNHCLASQHSDLKVQAFLSLHERRSGGSLDLVRLDDEGLVDVGNDTTAGNSGLDESVELLVTSDGEKQMSGGDSLDLEVLGGVTSELENLGGEVFKDGSTVDGRGGTDSAVGAHSALQESVDSTDGELQE